MGFDWVVKRKGVGRLGLLILIALLNSLCFGEDIVPRSDRGVWNRAAKAAGVPGILNGPREVKVIVHVTGGYSTVTLIGSTHVTSKELGELLRSWSGGRGEVVWGDDELGPAAVHKTSRGRFGELSNSTVVELDDLQSRLSRAGLEGYLVLRWPVGSEGSPDGEVVEKRGLWEVVEVGKGWPRVERTEVIRPTELLTFLLIAFGQVLASWGILRTAGRMLRQESVESMIRFERARQILLFGSIFVGFVAFGLYVFLLGWGVWGRVWSVWFGIRYDTGSISDPLIISLISTMAVMLIGLVKIGRYAKDHFPLSVQASGDRIYPVTLAGKDGESGVLSCLSIICLLGTSFASTLVDNGQFRAVMVGLTFLILLFVFGSTFLWPILRGAVLRPELLEKADHPVVGAVVRVLQRASRGAVEVELVDGPTRLDRGGVSMKEGVVRVGSELADCGDPLMMEVGIAFAAAENREGVLLLGRTLLLLLASALLTALASVAINGPLAWAVLSLWLIGVGTVAVLTWIFIVPVLRQDTIRRNRWKATIRLVGRYQPVARYAAWYADRFDGPVWGRRWDDRELAEEAGRELGFDPRDPGS